jgi:hypothetical protein
MTLLSRLTMPVVTTLHTVLASRHRRSARVWSGSSSRLRRASS